MNAILVLQDSQGWWCVARITNMVDHLRRPVDTAAQLRVYKRMPKVRAKAQAVRLAKTYIEELKENGNYEPPLLIQERAIEGLG